MSGARKVWKGSVGRTGREICAELRSIIRQVIDLRQPLFQFERDRDRPDGVPNFYVRFNLRPRVKFTGLRVNCPIFRLPDERIEDAVTGLAKSVWHLKDRIHQWVKAKGLDTDVNAWAKQCPALLVAADLANWKKHGRNENMSGLKPQLQEVVFDTSRSGTVELYYNGATKEKELLVTNTEPIPFRMEMKYQDETIAPDAVEVIHNGFLHWCRLIRQIGILDPANREDEVLIDTLFHEEPGEVPR